MIPATRLHPRAMRDLDEFLRTSWQTVKGARSELEAKWYRWHRMYRTRPKTERKTFPFPGCSNIEVPVIATDVDIIYARLMAMMFGPSNLWSVKAQREDMIDLAPRIQEFLEWAQHNELDMYDAISDFTLEVCKLGTGVLKTRYRREWQHVYEFREQQLPGPGAPAITTQQRTILMRDHPQVQHVPLFDFYIPPNTRSIAESAWVGQRVNLTWSQFLSRANAGIYQGSQRLATWRGTSRGSEMEQMLSRLEMFEPNQSDRFEMMEFWLPWDVSGTGEQCSIVATYHVDSWERVRIDYNPFFNQLPPFDEARYLRVEGRFYGIGIAEMLESTQAEVTTMHNQRIDNGTVMNAAVIVALNDGTIKQGEPIFPGRVLLVNDMNNFQVKQLGQPLSSTIADEQISLQYGKARTGVNDWISGADGSTNYAAATTAVQQLREGEKRFDQVLREFRRCLGAVGTKVVELYQQFNQGGKTYYAMGPADGAAVAQILNFPLDLIRKGVAINVTATSAQYNKEVEIRTNMLVMGMMTQHYQQLIQLISLAINPQVPAPLQAIAMQAANAQSVILRRIMDQHGQQDVNRLVPDLRETLSGQSPGLGAIAGAFGGGTPVGQGAPTGTGMVPSGQGFGGGFPPGQPSFASF